MNSIAALMLYGAIHMRLARLAGSALIALLMSSVMLAQIPNFSGKWTLAPVTTTTTYKS